MTIYAEVAQEYFNKGWWPVPVDPDTKELSVTGVTGHEREGRHTVTQSDVTKWIKAFPNHNVAITLPHWIIGIDVDDYDDKTGGETLKEWEQLYGPLPKSPLSTAREGISGIRFFRVPDGFQYEKNFDSIEIIQFHHRYAVVQPSMHKTGNTYHWNTKEIPNIDDVPELPTRYFELLNDGFYTPKKVREDQTINPSFREGPMCKPVQEALERWTQEIDHGTGARHDAAVSGSLRLVSLAGEGHAGVTEALQQLEDVFVVALGGERDAEAEFQSAVDGAEEMVEVSAEVCECLPIVGPFIDWDELWTANLETYWLIEPLIAIGDQVALVAEAKTGKSLLAMEMAAALGLGKAALFTQVIEPIDVLYLDYEQSRRDIRDRFQKMGITQQELKNGKLHYAHIPSLPSLDTKEGGLELLKLAQDVGAKLVIIDTMSRVLEGEENSNDTIRRFYRYSGSLLKRHDIALLRLDHTGKDASKGARGGSAKRDDVDAEWSLRKLNYEGTELALQRLRGRRNDGESAMMLHRVQEPILMHVAELPKRNKPKSDGEKLEVHTKTLQFLNNNQLLDDVAGWNATWSQVKNLDDHPTQAEIREAVNAWNKADEFYRIMFTSQLESGR